MTVTFAATAAAFLVLGIVFYTFIFIYDDDEEEEETFYKICRRYTGKDDNYGGELFAGLLDDVMLALNVFNELTYTSNVQCTVVERLDDVTHSGALSSLSLSLLVLSLSLVLLFASLFVSESFS